MVLVVTNKLTICSKLGSGSASNPVDDDADRMAGWTIGFPTGS